jgi:hypothetical protein
MLAGPARHLDDEAALLAGLSRSTSAIGSALRAT